MAETPVWPAYQIGSHDSIFALGVVSLALETDDATLALLR